jgi:hypothetical protein
MFLIVAAVAAVAACGGGGGGDDTSKIDASTKIPDGSVKNDAKTPDSGSQAACTHVTSWPAMQPLANFNEDPNTPGTGFTNIISVDKTAAPFAALTVEDWHLNNLAYPHTVTLKNTDLYFGQNGCSDCVLLDSDCSGPDVVNDCNHHFFAQGGSLTVTRADEANTGMMTVSGTNIHLVEWDMDQSSPTVDTPIKNGQCYDVDSFSMTGSWDHPPADGGADAQ